MGVLVKKCNIIHYIYSDYPVGFWPTWEWLSFSLYWGARDFIGHCKSAQRLFSNADWMKTVFLGLYPFMQVPRTLIRFVDYRSFAAESWTRRVAFLDQFLSNHSWPEESSHVHTKQCKVNETTAFSILFVCLLTWDVWAFALRVIHDHIQHRKEKKTASFTSRSVLIRSPLTRGKFPRAHEFGRSSLNDSLSKGFLTWDVWAFAQHVIHDYIQRGKDNKTARLVLLAPWGHLVEITRAPPPPLFL